MTKIETFESDYLKFINEETRPEVKYLFRISFKKLVEEYPETFGRLRRNTGFKIKEGQEEKAKEILKKYYIPPYKFKTYTTKYINKAGDIKEYLEFYNYNYTTSEKHLIFVDLYNEEFVKKIIYKIAKTAYKANEIYEYIQNNNLDKYKTLTKQQISNFVNRSF